MCLNFLPPNKRIIVYALVFTAVTGIFEGFSRKNKKTRIVNFFVEKKKTKTL
jgi:hypothetical protein